MGSDEATGRVRPRGLESRAWGVVLIVLYGVVVCAPLVIAGVAHAEDEESFLAELGKSAGLVGLVLLCLQIVLAARLRWIERPFGLDRLFVFHRRVGVIALGFVLAHPILLASAYGWGLLYNVRQPWFIWLGKAGLVLLVLLVLAALYRRRWGIEFERWRTGHNLTVVVFAFGFVHSWIVGDDVHVWAMQLFWLALLGIVVASYVHHRLVAPAVARRRAYRITEVRRETPDVWTLRMEPPEGGRRFDYRPGQFQFLTLMRADRTLPVEEHPFTIASSPTEPLLAASIKESGDFTSTVGRTQPGDRAAVRGPYGRFSHTFGAGETSLVFIAGGIGITPLVSMLRYMRDTREDVEVLLIWGNKTEADIAFREELDRMAAGERPRLRVVHVLNAAGEDWKGERGYVDRDRLQRLVGEGVEGRTYFVCGPPVMMEKVFGALRELGVQAGRVYYERFEL